MKYLAVLSLVVVLSGCGSSYPPLIDCSINNAIEEGDESVTEFRNVYYSVAHQAGFSDEQIAMQILLPPRTPGRPLATEDLAQDSPVEAATRRYQGLCPVLLYQNGADQPPVFRPGIRDSLRSQPPTFIIVPGIFGEFIESAPFDSIAKDASSSFAQSHRGSLTALTDAVYDLVDLGTSQLPLVDLVSLGSLDDGQGAALVNLVLLNPHWGSLETVVAHPEAAAIYLQRLDRVFSRLPSEATNDIYILGYSRGSPLGLEMLVSACQDLEQHPWADRLRGFVSLGGVLFGSELADLALHDPNSADYRLLAELRDTADDLVQDQDGDSEAEKLEHTVANSFRWVEAVANIAAVLSDTSAPHPGLNREPLSGDIPKLSAVTALLNSVITDLFLSA